MARPLIRGVVTIALLLLPLLLAFPAYAQDDGDADTPPPEATREVSFDEVNAVAEQMYCPVCEMEPLDTCRAPTCITWREQIRAQLAAGMSEDEIIDGFVARYGDRVVGVPESDDLRLLSFIGPVLGALAALAVGVVTFSRWRANRDDATATLPDQPDAPGISEDDHDDDNPYRSRLEDDLKD